ncbi:MAG TPA: matrixin family metalloprotease [Candidatus Paceibacterota bacterium]
MRRFFDFVVLATVVLGGAYLAYAHPAQVRHLMRAVHDTVAPCSSPITYSLGAIDPRFDLSTSTLIADLARAEGIWEAESDKNLFEYVEKNGEVTVSFMYDERQAATDKLASLGIKIDESKATYDSLKAKYDALSGSVQTEQRMYKSAVAEYEQREAAYNADVKKWNDRGGAPPAEYAKLTVRKQQLEDDLSSIRRMEERLNKNIDTLNALATTLNQLIVHLNLNVEQYNQAGAKGGEFEEGLYELQNGVETITIYEFSDTTKLVRVLAHEFGHALDLEHVEDEKAIMYEINKGTALKATDADIAELNAACRIKSGETAI